MRMQISASQVKELRERTGAGIMACKKALAETKGGVEAAVEILRKRGEAIAEKKGSRETAEGMVSARIRPDGTAGVLLEVNCETDFVARNEEFQSLVGLLVRKALETSCGDAEAIEAAAKEEITERIAKLGENIRPGRMAFYDLQGPGLLGSYVHFGSKIGVIVEVGCPEVEDPRLAELVKDLTLQIASARPLYLQREDVPGETIEKERDIFRAQALESGKPEKIVDRIVEGKIRKRLSEICLLDQPFVKEEKTTVRRLIESAAKEMGTGIEIRRFARFEVGS